MKKCLSTLMVLLGFALPAMATIVNDGPAKPVLSDLNLLKYVNAQLLRLIPPWALAMRCSHIPLNIS